jgi:hypothetical protein
MWSISKCLQGIVRVGKVARAGSPKRIGKAAILSAVVWGVLIMFHASFADQPGSSVEPGPRRPTVTPGPPAKVAFWKQRWQESTIREARAGHCNKEMGEEIGWLISPLLNGFYYGYLATPEVQWIDRLVECTDAWMKRGVTEPDGYVGWPKVGAAGTDVDNLDSYYADSLLGEAMVLRPVVLMSALIVRTPALSARYSGKANVYLKRAQAIFEKWDKRGAWRPSGDGVMTVVLPFGIEVRTGQWTEGFREKDAPGHGFSHPDNKANLVASWLLAMFDATGDPVYRERAEKWFRVMKSRMKLDSDGTYRIWNYWEPAGAWDYRYYVLNKHWIGVHPNAGYYVTDVDAIVDAYEHGLVFTTEDISRLVKTALANRRNWPALAPYDGAIRKEFEESVKPDGWAEMSRVPWYLSRQVQRAD